MCVCFITAGPITKLLCVCFIRKMETPRLVCAWAQCTRTGWADHEDMLVEAECGLFL